MAFALVGAAGTATQGAVNTAVTPAWGAGAARTAGNLLLCFVSMTGSVSQPATPSGWRAEILSAATGNSSAMLFTKKATGGDTAPTIAAVTTGVISAHLEEWSGNLTTTSFPADQIGGTNSPTSPITATLSGADLASGVLVAMVGADFRSAARASNDTWTSNHGTPTLRASNNGASTQHHYSHATLITNSNSGADTAVMTLSLTTSITGLAVVAASFKAAPPAAADMPYVNPYPSLLAQ